MFTNKALKNLHITIPASALLAVIICTIYATSYANSHENRLQRVEEWEVKIEQIENIERNTKNIRRLEVAVIGIEKKFDTKFDKFQSDLTSTIIKILKD